MSNDEPTTANGVGNNNQPEDTNKRINVWLNEEEYNRMRSLLIRQRTSFSKWVRKQIEGYLEEYENKPSDYEEALKHLSAQT